MGSMSIWHWLIVLAVVLLMFGAGRLPRVMGDFAKGIKAFKAGMKEGEETPPPAPAQPTSSIGDQHTTAQPHSTVRPPQG